MDVAKPRRAAFHEEYARQCQEALDLPLADLVDRAIIAGWDPREFHKAVEKLARMRALGYKEDPDPAGE